MRKMRENICNDSFFIYFISETWVNIPFELIARCGWRDVNLKNIAVELTGKICNFSMHENNLKENFFLWIEQKSIYHEKHIKIF